jgi:tetratricopeptide (TPR) repeat protein
MRSIPFIALTALLSLGEVAGEPESIPKDDLIEAYREFRAAAAEFTAGMTAMYEAASFASKKSEAEMKADRDRRYRAALPHIELSVELNPYYSPAYEMRAIILRDAKGDLAGAVRDFTTAVELDPEQESSIVARAELLLQLGRIEEARRDLADLEGRESRRAPILRGKIDKSEQDGGGQPAARPESK